MNRKQRRAAAKQGRSNSPSPGGVNIAPEARLLAEAASHHQAGRLAQAERLYRRILAVDPKHIDSLHLFGPIMPRPTSTSAFRWRRKATAMRRSPTTGKLSR